MLASRKSIRLICQQILAYSLAVVYTRYILTRYGLYWLRTPARSSPVVEKERADD
jgi:hypothetical protein